MSRQKNQKKIDNFRISLVDDSSHEHLWTVRFGRTQGIVSLITIVVVVVALCYCLFAFTPLKTFIPGYPDGNSKRAAVQNTIKIDSLERLIDRWELYSENLSRIVDGEEPVSIDSIIAISSAKPEAQLSPEELADRDSAFRAMVTQKGQFEVSDSERKLPIEGIQFFTPLKGVVFKGFDRVMHPYIEVSAPPGSLVLSVLEGTVVFEGWNDESGYTIVLQHSNDLISIYKHNQKLLKALGDNVSAGSPIALIGDDNSASGDLLHFELWYRGEAVDPTMYISF